MSKRRLQRLGIYKDAAYGRYILTDAPEGRYKSYDVRKSLAQREDHAAPISTPSDAVRTLKKWQKKMGGADAFPLLQCPSRHLTRRPLPKQQATCSMIFSRSKKSKGVENNQKTERVSVRYPPPIFFGAMSSDAH